MQKQIHVNSYVKRDGTQVKEHFRNIDTDNYGTPPIVPEYPNDPVMNMESGPVLQGGVSVDVGFPAGGGIGDVLGSIGGVLGTVVAVGLELAPITLQMYQAMNSGNGQAVEYLKPQFNTKIKQLDTQVAQMKTNIDNNITKLVNAKNKIEYSKIYAPLQKDWQTYQQANNFVNRIKAHINNGDYQSVVNDLGNFVNENQRQVITDLLQPNVKLQNNINNAKDIINKYHLDEKFKYALAHNVSGENHSADFSDYSSTNIKINKFLNRNRPNAQEMANIFLAKPQNIPLSKEYSYIPKGNANIINFKYNLTGNKLIPQDWEGMVFNQYSSLSKNVSNSVEMQNKIREQFNIMRTDTLNDKLEIGFSQDSNLHLSIGHATILEPYIDSQGYFHGILFDKYDFSWLEFYKNLNYDTYKAYIANDYFALIQLLNGHNYYILAPILFKW